MDVVAGEQLTNYQNIAKRIRAQICRISNIGEGGHIGSCLSMVELLIVLYYKILKVDPKHPDWSERDRFILSKGHGGLGVYIILAERGFFPKDWLNDFRQEGSHLGDHISYLVPGVELSTGSLGHGLPVAVGMALNCKIRKKKYRVFVLMGDGGWDEGSNWEAALFAAQHHLSNLVAIVDYNNIQAFGRNKDIIDLEPFAKKFESFNWSVKEINGHNFQEIDEALNDLPLENGKPSCIIAHTLKGKGISFLEDTLGSHYKYCNDEELVEAYKELGVIL